MGKTKDDRVLSPETMLSWAGRDIVVTEKMDGENTTLYDDYIHARSLDYESRVDRDRIKAFHANIRHNIPAGWRICGENLTATHAISYKDLPHFFLAFSIWHGMTCMNWDDTVLYSLVLGLNIVPILYRGPWEGFNSEDLMTSGECEGYVIRPAASFDYRDFPTVVGKYVRAGHVGASHEHWTRRQITWNEWKE